MCVCIYLYICISNSCFFGFGCLPSFPPCGCLVALALVTAHVATGRDMIHAMQSLWWNENAGKKVLASLRFLSCTTPSLSDFPLWLSPWYNRTGWLGVKHQLTYLPTLALPAAAGWLVPPCSREIPSGETLERPGEVYMGFPMHINTVLKWTDHGGSVT